MCQYIIGGSNRFIGQAGLVRNSDPDNGYVARGGGFGGVGGPRKPKVRLCWLSPKSSWDNWVSSKVWEHWRV